MIPRFPQFKHIELSDRAAVEAHTNKYEPYSDFNFTCLWIWDTAKKRMISELNGNLIVKFTDYTTNEPFLSFLGVRDPEGTTRTLLEYSRSEGLPSCLRLLPDVSVEGIRSSAFSVEEDRDDFDYIYSVQSIATLRGSNYDSKRGRLHKFWQENPAVIVSVIDLTNKENHRRVMDMFTTWEKNKMISKGGEYIPTYERVATERLLSSDVLDRLCAIGLFSEDSIIGYYIGEIVPSAYAIGRFSKFDVSYKGIYETLMHGYAKHLETLQVFYLNVESDIGVESMRRSKMSWRPVKFLKRYRVQYAQI